jgi:hypothetical protein
MLTRCPPYPQDGKIREKKINPRDLEEEEEDVNTTKGWTDEIERRKLKWWEILLYQKEVIYIHVHMCHTMTSPCTTEQ